MKIRNIIFSALFCIFLCGPAALWVAQEKIHLDLPSWFTAEDSKFLSGGIIKANVKANLSLDGFTSEKLQNALEIKIGNYVPAKATVVLNNASLQRDFIAASNTVFGWSCYPTYYSSTILYSEQDEALYQMPLTDFDTHKITYIEFIKALDELAKQYPEKQFVVYSVDISRLSKVNPATKLISKKTATIADYLDLSDIYSNSSNLHFLAKIYDSSTEYHKYFYTTDHHWNGYGAADAMNQICELLNVTRQNNDFSYTLPNNVENSNFTGLKMNGSDSRLGLMLLNAPIQEPLYNMNNIKIKQGQPSPFYQSDPQLVNIEPLEAEFDFYHSWFGKEEIELFNPYAKGDILMVGDSYTYSLRWFAGLTAESTVQKMDFTNKIPGQCKQSNVTLANRISSSDAKSILLVAEPSDFEQMMEVYPGYFNL